jgi:hypothetical protein
MKKSMYDFFLKLSRRHFITCCCIAPALLIAPRGFARGHPRRAEPCLHEADYYRPIKDA